MPPPAEEKSQFQSQNGHRSSPASFSPTSWSSPIKRLPLQPRHFLLPFPKGVGRAPRIWSFTSTNWKMGACHNTDHCLPGSAPHRAPERTPQRRRASPLGQRVGAREAGIAQNWPLGPTWGWGWAGAGLGLRLSDKQGTQPGSPLLESLLCWRKLNPSALTRGRWSQNGLVPETQGWGGSDVSGYGQLSVSKLP